MPQLEMFDQTINQDQAAMPPEPQLVMTHWAVIEKDSEQFDRCVWGVGKTAEEALKDAAEQMIEWGKPSNLRTPVKSVDDLRRAITRKIYHLVPATKELIKDVRDYGGEIDFVITRQGCCIQEEYDGA